MSISNHVFYNPNPKHKNVGDCAVRAMTKALNVSWDDAYTAMSAIGFVDKNIPSANVVFGRLLYENGYKIHHIETVWQADYTVDNFCIEHPVGTFVLQLDGHVVCVCDGKIYDTWDSGNELVIYYWAYENNENM